MFELTVGVMGICSVSVIEDNISATVYFESTDSLNPWEIVLVVLLNMLLSAFAIFCFILCNAISASFLSPSNN